MEMEGLESATKTVNRAPKELHEILTRVGVGYGKSGSWHAKQMVTVIAYRALYCIIHWNLEQHRIIRMVSLRQSVTALSTALTDRTGMILTSVQPSVLCDAVHCGSS